MLLLPRSSQPSLKRDQPPQRVTEDNECEWLASARGTCRQVRKADPDGRGYDQPDACSQAMIKETLLPGNDEAERGARQSLSTGPCWQSFCIRGPCWKLSAQAAAGCFAGQGASRAVTLVRRCLLPSITCVCAYVCVRVCVCVHVFVCVCVSLQCSAGACGPRTGQCKQCGL